MPDSRPPVRCPYCEVVLTTLEALNGRCSGCGSDFSYDLVEDSE